MGILTAHNEGTPICNFRNSAKTPIRSLKFHFSPKQAGSGDPSPSNVREIQGWDSLDWWKTGKNVGEVKNYGASTFNYDATPSAGPSSYGTSINSTTYNLPDTALVITQSQWPESSDPKHYRNGYFTINVPNLIFGQYYDVSFKITNIVNNPLNTSVNQLTLINPYGNQYGPNKILNDNVLIFKNVFFKQRTDKPKYYCFDVRNCGMSFTLSEFMVTPAYQNDGVFEPYKGTKTTFAFPTRAGGTNLLNLEAPEVDYIKFDSKYIGLAYNTSQHSFQVNETMISNISITSNSLSFTTGSATAYGIAYFIYLKPQQTYVISASSVSNGKIKIYYFDKNLNYLSNITVTLSTSFTIPDNAYYSMINFQPSTSNTNVSFSNPQLELGSTATTYEAYVQTNTIYGGSIDLAKGEAVITHVAKNMPSASTIQYVVVAGTESPYVCATKSSYPNLIPDNTDPQLICNKLKPAGMTVGITIGTYEIGFYEDSNNHLIRTIIGLPSEISDVSKYGTWLNELGTLQMCYKLATPQIFYFPPIDLETFLDHNVFWSNAEGEVEIDYDLHEVRSMTEAKKMAMTYPHHKKVVWNQMLDPLTSDYWTVYSSSNLTVSFSDGIADIEITDPSNGRYSRSIKPKAYLPSDTTHKYYISYMINPEYNGQFGAEWAGGNQDVVATVCPANQWSRISIRNTGYRNSNSISVYIPFPTLSYFPQGVNPKMKIKSPIYIDLTLMFGAGNEPTKDEFEHLCALNNIDLTQYYPKNTTGTEQWWIVP